MENKIFVSCPKCGHPMMPEWHDCPYCKIKDVKPLSEASLGLDIVAIVVALLFFIGTAFSFFAIDWGNEKSKNDSKLHSKDKEEFGPVEPVENEELDILWVDAGDGFYESLSHCFEIVNNSTDKSTDKYWRARRLLEIGIAENIRRFEPKSKDAKKLSDTQLSDCIALYGGLKFFESQMPAKGCVLASSGRYGNSPLRINTDTGGGYVVKLVNVDTKRTERLLFIPEHWEYEIDVPDGEYEIRYMIGSKWYGDKILFGKECSCARADRTFLFHDGQGFTITLRKVKNGNLRTEDIEMGDF